VMVPIFVNMFPLSFLLIVNSRLQDLS